MATSGSVDYNRTAEQIIRDALELLGVIGTHENLEGNDYTTCLNTLNIMIKAWQSQGLHLWTEKEGVLFLNDSQVAYQLGGTGADEASSEIIATTLSGDEAAGQTTLSVTDTSSMAASDNIGIVLNSGTIFWTTISSLTSTTVTVASGLTTAASSGQPVYAYTSAIGRPLHISQVRLIDSEGVETELRPLSRLQYFRIPNKTQTGVPSQYYIDKQTSYTKMYIHPVSEDSTNRLRFSYKRIMEDIDSSTDDLDFPQEWIACLTYNLAVWVAPKYNLEEKCGTGPTSIAVLASQSLKALKEWDQEQVPMYFRPSGPRDYNY